MTLALMSNSAFATKARLLALGMDETDNEGSYYIDDSRNIFLNAGNIVNYSDMAIFEWGNDGNTVTARTSVDQNSKPQAEGGFLKSAGNYTYGIYMGAESNTSALLRVVGSSKTTGAGLLDTSDNQLDFFFGTRLGDIAVGADVVYVNGDNDSNKSEDSALALKVGAVASEWQGFINLSLDSSAKEQFSSGTETHEFDGKFGVHIGGSYNLGKGKLFGKIKTFSWDQKDSSVTGGRKSTVEGKFSSYSLGYGTVHEVSSKSNIFTSVEYKVKQIEADFGVASAGASGAKTEAENTWIPLTIGYEAEATEWLTLRGSITTNITGSKDNKNYANLNTTAQGFATQQFGSQGKSTIANSTVVNAGTTLNFGKLKVDGLVGTDASTSKTGTQGGTLRLDNLMTRVGMTYNF